MNSKLKFARNNFSGPNADIERLLEVTKGAIFLKRLKNGEPFDPKEEGRRLYRVISLLFPEETISALIKKMCEDNAVQEKPSEITGSKTGLVLNI